MAETSLVATGAERLSFLLEAEEGNGSGWGAAGDEVREGQGDRSEAQGKGPASDGPASGEEPESQTRPSVNASEVLSRRTRSSFKAMTDGGRGGAEGRRVS